MAAPAWRRQRFRPLLLVPAGLFVLLGLVLAWGLTQDPKEIPSALIGRPVPAFELPPVQGRTLGLSSADLAGEVSLVNVFASWCVACREEHPLLVQLGRQGVVPIHGLNYKDRPEDAQRWLDDMETFVVDHDGRIAYKHIGPLTPQFVEQTLLPLIARLRR